MLSFTQSDKARAIAIVKNGNSYENNKTVYLYSEPGNIQSNTDRINPVQLLGEEFFRKLKLSYEELEELVACMRNNYPPREKSLKLCYEICMEKLKTKLGNEIVISSGTFEVLPNVEKREIIYVSGPAGSGKSFWINQYANKYAQIFKGNNIFLFSKVENDTSLDNKNLKKIVLNQSIVTDPIKTSELDNSLCIFDDTDTLTDKKIQKAVDDLKNDIMQIGRHDDIWCAFSSHQLNNGPKTRIILNECHAVVFFLNTGSSYYINYFLKRYAGCSKEQLNKIMSLKSRWVMIYLHAPRYVVSENSIFLLT